MIPTAKPRPKDYIAWHFAFARGDVDRNISDGRRFYTLAGFPLRTKLDVADAFKRDGEVISL